MTPEFWRGKRVLITGHTGFKGSWLCLWLDTLGAKVSGYALDPPTKPSLYQLARVNSIVESTTGDIRNLDDLSKRVASFAPDVVLHMAAQSVVLRSYEDPTDTYSTNVMGTVNVMEAIRQTRHKCVVVNVTTDKVYENRRWIWGYRENDALGGHDPYSNSKACAEFVARSYRDSFFPIANVAKHGVAIGSARAGNVIGGGDWTPHQLLPDVIAAMVAKKSVVLRHPEAVRPWQHVLDCLGGYLTLAEALVRDPARHSGDWNFGPADSDVRSVAYLVEQIARHWNAPVPWMRDSETYPTEEMELRLDSSKAGRFLDWRGRLPLNTALEWVSRWYQRFHAGEDPREVSLDQIRQYMALG